MKHSIISIVVLLVLFIYSSCTKFENFNNDADGKNHIRGRVFYSDSIKGDGTFNYLPNVTLKISSSSDTINYIYSVRTDSFGYFLFPFVNSGDFYISADTVINGVQVSCKQPVTIKNSIDTLSVKLSHSNKQNGIVYTVTDINGGLINSCSVCLFSSKVLFYADSTCNGSTYTNSTNLNGRVSFLNVSPGNYYVKFISVNPSIKLKGVDTTLYTYTDSVIFREIYLK